MISYLFKISYAIDQSDLILQQEKYTILMEILVLNLLPGVLQGNPLILLSVVFYNWVST